MRPYGKLALLGTLCLMLLTAADVRGQDRQRRSGRRAAAEGKEPPHPPQVGDEAPDFELMNLKSEPVTLSQLTENHNVVLVVLRGWPGYQCPICSRQVNQLLEKKAEFEKYDVHVVMVYPGPTDLLADHATEFQGDREFPDNFHYVTDPDYGFTNAWGLRWEADRETAWPSTFIVGKDGTIKYGVTSTSHGGRAATDTVLEELANLK